MEELALSPAALAGTLTAATREWGGSGAEADGTGGAGPSVAYEGGAGAPGDKAANGVSNFHAGVAGRRQGGGGSAADAIVLLDSSSDDEGAAEPPAKRARGVGVSEGAGIVAAELAKAALPAGLRAEEDSRARAGAGPSSIDEDAALAARLQAEYEQEARQMQREALELLRPQEPLPSPRWFDGATFFVSKALHRDPSAHFSWSISRAELLRGCALAGNTSKAAAPRVVLASTMLHDPHWMAGLFRECGADSAETEVFFVHDNAGRCPPDHVYAKQIEKTFGQRWNITSYRPNEGSGIFHAKVLIARYDAHLRVIILSSNLMPQFEHVVEVCWAQDFPILGEGEPDDSGGDFRAQLEKLISGMYKCDAAPTQRVLVALRLARFRLSEAQASLVVTLGSKGGGTGKAGREGAYGHMRVRHLLQQAPLWPAAAADAPLMIQAGHIGKLSRDFVWEVCDSFRGAPMSGEPQGDRSPTATVRAVQVTYPGMATACLRLDRAGAGLHGGFPAGKDKDFLCEQGIYPDIFRDAVERLPTSAPKTLRRFAHCKVFMRLAMRDDDGKFVNREGEELAAVLMLGSNNFSKNSLGLLGPRSLKVNQYMVECSVLLKTTSQAVAREWARRTPVEMPGEALSADAWRDSETGQMRRDVPWYGYNQYMQSDYRASAGAPWERRERADCRAYYREQAGLTLPRELAGVPRDRLYQVDDEVLGWRPMREWTYAGQPRATAGEDDDGGTTSDLENATQPDSLDVRHPTP